MHCSQLQTAHNYSHVHDLQHKTRSKHHFIYLLHTDTKDGQVAFLAQFSSTESVITPASGPFHMDKVIFNDGNGYDPLTGIFTAPVSGVYIFAAQFFTHSVGTDV